MLRDFPQFLHIQEASLSRTQVFSELISIESTESIELVENYFAVVLKMKITKNGQDQDQEKFQNVGTPHTYQNSNLKSYIVQMSKTSHLRGFHVFIILCKFKFQTRKHSSRMCTVRSSSRQGGSPLGTLRDQTPGSRHPLEQTFPPVDIMTDTCKTKPCPNFVAGGNKKVLQ